MEKTVIPIRGGLGPGVPNQDLVSLSFQHGAVLPAWLQHPAEPQPAGSCGSPVQRHEAAVLHGWCEQGFPLPAEQTASGWPRAAPGQPVVCCTSPVHGQVLTGCHSPQQTLASWSLHVTLTVPLPRRAGGGTGWGVAGWVLGLVTQLGSQHCWTRHCKQQELLPRLGLRGEGGYNSLSSAGVWEQGWTASGKGRLPLS